MRPPAIYAGLLGVGDVIVWGLERRPALVHRVELRDKRTVIVELRGYGNPVQYLAGDLVELYTTDQLEIFAREGATA